MYVLLNKYMGVDDLVKIIIIIIKFWYKKDNVLYNQIITNYKLFN